MIEITKENCEELAMRVRSAASLKEAGEILGWALETAETGAAWDAIKATARKCAEVECVERIRQAYPQAFEDEDAALDAARPEGGAT